MNCLKCGVVVAEGASFCENCLTGMQDYPVPMDAVVQLPSRKEDPARRAAARRRPVLTPEQQIAQLKKRVRVLVAVIGALVLLEALLVTTSVLYFQKHKGPLPGQNYSTTGTTVPPAGK